MTHRLAPLCVLAGAALAACSGGKDEHGPAPAKPAEAPPVAESTTADEATDVIERLEVVVYFPAAAGGGLVGEPRQIFRTAAAGDLAKQILADLLAGPATDAALEATPPGTQLRQVYVLDGTAYIDFSADLRQGMHGGSAAELLTVYAIVDSVALNVPEVERVGILVEGRPIETLNGHLDLRRPLSPDKSWIVGRQKLVVAAPDASPPSG